MTTIGAAWIQVVNKETNNYSVSVKLDEAILPLTLTAEKRLILKINKNKKEAKQPDYYVDMFVPQKVAEIAEEIAF